MEPRPSNVAQKTSPSYRLAALDGDFILGDGMRGVRFMLEYEKAEAALRRWNIRSTVVVFGSARVREDGPGKDAFWYGEARRLGAAVSRMCGAIDGDTPRDDVIATGGGPGIMEAANRGASEVGAPSIGFNITLPREQEPNPYTTPDLTFRFHYFAMRKMHLAMRARALIVFPGGFGTLDELFEIVTLQQTRKAPMTPILMFDKAYWTEVINFEAMVRHNMVAPTDLDLIRFVESADEATEVLKSQQRMLAE